MPGQETMTGGNGGNGVQFSTEVTTKEKISERLSIPEELEGKTETFSSALDLLDQYAADRNEPIPDESIKFLNRALEIVDETSREVGYHDKRHGLDFAAALITQAVAVRGLLDKEDDTEIRQFIRSRMGEEYATDEFINALRETFTIEKITAAATVGLMHDMAELEGRDEHEERSAKKIAEEDWPDNIKDLAIPIIHSTKYSGEAGVVYTSWEEEGDYDAATKLLGRLAAASDYLDKFGDERYFDLGYTKLLDNLQELTIEQIRNYPLLLLAAEFYNGGTLYFTDIPSNLAATGFINDTMKGHNSSFKLIADSEGIPENLKERFQKRGFDKAERDEILDLIIDPEGNEKLSELVIRTASLMKAEELRRQGVLGGGPEDIHLMYNTYMSALIQAIGADNVQSVFFYSSAARSLQEQIIPHDLDFYIIVKEGTNIPDIELPYGFEPGVLESRVPGITQFVVNRTGAHKPDQKPELLDVWIATETLLAQLPESAPNTWEALNGGLLVEGTVISLLSQMQTLDLGRKSERDVAIENQKGFSENMSKVLATLARIKPEDIKTAAETRNVDRREILREIIQAVTQGKEIPFALLENIDRELIIDFASQSVTSDYRNREIPLGNAA